MRNRVVRVEAGLVVGLILLALGVLWTLDNLGFVNAGAYLRWWPALLVAWGVVRVLGVGGRRRPVAGGVLVIIGTLLLADEIRGLPFGIWDLWPVGLIALGALIIWRAYRGPVRWRLGERIGAKATDTGDPRSSELRSLAIMAGVERKVDSDMFRGGEAVALMGGLEVDLRNARLAEGGAVIDVLVMMGGVELFVPNDWRVEVEAIPFMGAVEDERKAPPSEARNVLRVRGFVMMGGLEVNDGTKKGRS